VKWEAGYDPTTGLLYCPPPDLVVPPVQENPDAQTLYRAMEMLRDIIADFPFDSEASRANMLGLIITGVIRFAITGQVPCALIGAHQPATGKD
jgi:hypothetical protein